MRATLFFVFSLVSASALAEIHILDDFESYTPGSPPGGAWSSSVNSEATILVTTDVFNSPGQAVEVLQIGDGGTGLLTRYHEPQSQLVSYTAFLRTNNVTRETITMSAREGGWPPGPWIAIGYNPGWISYYDGSAWHTITPAVNNQWYQIKLEVDVGAQNYNIYVDDMDTPLVTDADFWDNSITALDNIRFEVYQTGGVDPNASDAAWVDDVLVETPYSQTPAVIPAIPPVGLGLLVIGLLILAIRRSR